MGASEVRTGDLERKGVHLWALLGHFLAGSSTVVEGLLGQGP